MATNWGDALIVALRAVLVTVSGLPATRAWQNTSVTPGATTPHVADRFVAFDSNDRECGPTAWQRTVATYRVDVRQPIGIDAFDAMSLAAAISDAFKTACGAASLKVSGTYPVEMLASRIGPAQDLDAWLVVPVSLTLTFDHP
ncbi:MAG: hypothetical protein K2R93_12355 [Gemmatimonadaceae bacterium]|nr:hypothetical protein [Gemmatimonadaceae bacterium]